MEKKNVAMSIRTRLLNIQKHFHQSWNSEIDGILFSMLDIMEFKEIR